MKMKLSYIEFTALYDVLKHAATLQKSPDPYQMLLHAHVTRVYAKFYKLAIFKKSKYSIKLSEEEALAFWLVFESHNLPSDSFEGNLLNQLNGSIHKTLIAA